MGACSSKASAEAPSSGLRGRPYSAAPSNLKQPHLVASSLQPAAALHTANTWAAAPGSFCINDEDGKGETWDDLFPISGGRHRRTRSGYSVQLSHDPVHQRKLKALRELKARNMSQISKKKPSLALGGDSVSPIKEADDFKLETVDSSESPPSMSLSPADCPSSLRLKRTRPIRLKGERRMTAGQELLAPKKSKLKSAMFDRPRVQVSAVTSGSDEDSDDEEDVTPVVNNKSARRQKAPSVSITSSVLAVQHSPKSGALSPRGKSSTFDSIAVPPDHDTASSRRQQRPGSVVDTTPTGLISPKGARKSPKGTKAFDFSDDVADENKAPLMSPKGARKSPMGKTAFTFDSDKYAAPNSDLDASFSSVGMLSPRGEVRRRKSREKKKNKKKEEEEEEEEEVWYAVPKFTLGKKAKSLKEGGLGHCHPNAARR